MDLSRFPRRHFTVGVTPCARVNPASTDAVVERFVVAGMVELRAATLTASPKQSPRHLDDLAARHRDLQP